MDLFRVALLRRGSLLAEYDLPRKIWLSRGQAYRPGEWVLTREEFRKLEGFELSAPVTGGQGPPFVISDLHLGHGNIIDYCRRPFSSSGEMDRVLIRNWNFTVRPDDEIYFLGDLRHGRNALEGSRYLDILSGKMCFVYGNHDQGMTGGVDRIRVAYQGYSFLLIHDPERAESHRSDGSGTTYNWVNYLSKVSAEWKQKVGEGTSVRWPTGIGGKGNEGVAAYTKQIKGVIGYVELSYALTSKMNYGQVRNAAGNYITPSIESFAAAAKSAEWTSAKDFSLVITNAPGADAYPIAATNFILMYKQPKDADRSKQAREFFAWVYANGDDAARKLGYVPLPDELVKQIEAYWAAELKF